MEQCPLVSLEAKECIIYKEVSWNISSVPSIAPSSVSSEGFFSPNFEFAGAVWHMRIVRQSEGSNNILLYLVKEIPNPQQVKHRAVEWTVGIKLATGKVFVMENGKEDLEDSAGTTKTLLPGCVVSQRGFTYLRDTVIPQVRGTAFCVLRVMQLQCSHACSSAATMAPSAIRLVSDFRDLLSSGEESDVKFVVRGTEFKVHKAILCARVPVFKVMFQHGMLESQSSTVRIEDCEPEIFSKLLHFLYSGSIHGLCTEDIFSLYSVADKYQVDTLMAECVDMMRSSLSVDTFCRCATMAIQHREEKLLEHVIVFLSNNYRKIISSDSWKTFLLENPLQANDLLVKAIGIKDEPNDLEIQVMGPLSIKMQWDANVNC